MEGVKLEGIKLPLLWCYFTLVKTVNYYGILGNLHIFQGENYTFQLSDQLNDYHLQYNLIVLFIGYRNYLQYNISSSDCGLVPKPILFKSIFSKPEEHLEDQPNILLQIIMLQVLITGGIETRSWQPAAAFKPAKKTLHPPDRLHHVWRTINCRLMPFSRNILRFSHPCLLRSIVR